MEEWILIGALGDVRRQIEQYSELHQIVQNDSQPQSCISSIILTNIAPRIHTFFFLGKWILATMNFSGKHQMFRMEFIFVF